MEPNYLTPPPERLIQKVRNRLEELGIGIGYGEAAACVAALNEFLLETNEGREYIASQFGFDWTSGEDDMVYEVVTPEAKTIKVRGGEVRFLKTCIVKGEFIPPHQVSETPAEKTTCRDCGQTLHCTRLVKDPTSGDMIDLCNNCLTFQGDTQLKAESGGLEECEACPNSQCSFHPKKDNYDNVIHF